MTPGGPQKISLTAEELAERVEESHAAGGVAALDAVSGVVSELRQRMAALCHPGDVDAPSPVRRVLADERCRDAHPERWMERWVACEPCESWADQAAKRIESVMDGRCGGGCLVDMHRVPSGAAMDCQVGGCRWGDPTGNRCECPQRPEGGDVR